MRLLWQQIGNSIITEMLCCSNFDGIVLDLEHGCFSQDALYSCIQISTLMNKKVFVRVTYLDKTMIRLSLDAGCTGIILSTVENYEQATEFYQFCTYPVNGGKRGLGLVRENLWGEKPLSVSNPILIPQIETIRGVNNLESIASINFPYFLIGFYDLSSSLGKPGDFENKNFKDCVNFINKLLGDRIGYHLVSDVERLYKIHKKSDFIAISMDTLLIKSAITKMEEIIVGG